MSFFTNTTKNFPLTLSNSTKVNKKFLKNVIEDIPNI